MGESIEQNTESKKVFKENGFGEGVTDNDFESPWEMVNY